MLTLPQNALTRYGVAVLTSGLALLVTSQVPLLAERTPFAFFFAAVIFTAWFGGRMPGLVALVLSAILSIYFIISPVGSFVGDLSGFFPLTTFVGISLVLVLLTSTLGYHKRSVGESEERYRYLFENNPLPMWVFDLGTLEFLAVNTSAIRHYGYSRDEFMSMTIMDIRPTNSVPTLLNEVAANNNDLKSVGIWKHVKKDGTVIDAEIMSYTLQFEGRSARLVLAIDVTERERIAVAIRDSEERLLQVFGHCPVAVLIQKWNDGTFVEVNHEFTKLTGWTRDEVIGRTSTSLKMIDTNSMSGLREQLQEKKSIVDTEVLIKTRDGDTRNVIMGTVKADMQGKAHAITTLVDVTQRRRAEIERRTTEQRYRTLFDYSPDGILIADAESNYVDANDTMCKLLGYEKSELVGLHAADIVVPEEIPHIDEALAVINAKFAYYREWQFRRKDGTVFAGEVI
ncbi:MAG TPA: PAS domain S-box protein, partial [Pyrinomonadaceae bacterium]|nr:PAS domain S-box protein [Pyrinomonadaceae bacterium]